MTKTVIRFFTVADFQEEEKWLQEQSKKGLKLLKMVPPCFFVFEQSIPEDVIYRLDYKNNTECEDYMQMLNDYGWEYVGKCIGWLYFRKTAEDVTVENDGELFSDNSSRIGMVEHVMKTRLLPLAIIFLCCVLPNVSRSIDGGVGTFFTVFWLIMLAIYVFLLAHCGIKLRKIKKELE